MLALASCGGWAGADEIIRRRAESVAALREVEQAGREASGAALGTSASARDRLRAQPRAAVLAGAWPEAAEQEAVEHIGLAGERTTGRRCSGCAAGVGARRDKSPARASSSGRANQLPPRTSARTSKLASGCHVRLTSIGCWLAMSYFNNKKISGMLLVDNLLSYLKLKV
jgi:hypothetical protein